MSKYNDFIRYAAQRGYKVDPLGQVISPLNNILKLRKYKTKCKSKDLYYCRFSVKYKGKSRPVPVHRFIAYLKFGEAALAPGIQSRHLDSNSLNNCPDNIAIGSGSDNQMDRNPALQKAMAKHAASFLRKLNLQQYISLLLDHAAGIPYNKLKVKYNLAKSTVAYIIRRETYK